MNFKLFNDSDEIYSKPIIEQGTGYVCPVCHKKYKTKKGIEEHYSNRSCYTYRQIFENTEGENSIYSIYSSTHAIFNLANGTISQHMSLKQFRVSSLYPAIAKFWFFCYNNKITDKMEYVEYIILKYKPIYMWKIFHTGIRQTVLEKFMRHRRKEGNPNEERFCDENSHHIGYDPDFTIRALERGDVTLDYLFGTLLDFNKFLDSLNRIERNRFIKLLEVMAKDNV